MLTLYEQSETDFTHNGLGVICATSATVTEELNGLYELSLTCPGLSNNMMNALDRFNVIKAQTPKGYQLFRIYRVNKTMGGEISVNARHVYYDALYNLVEDASSSAMTADEAIKYIYGRTAYSHRFTVSSDISNKNGAFEFININPVTAVLGDGGLAEIYGGEIQRDNFNITLKSAIGQNRGFEIRYRKNLTGLDVNSSIEKTATRIKPFCKNATGGAVYLPERFLDSPSISMYPWPLYTIIEYSDITVGRNGVTESSAQTEMRNRVLALYSSGIDMPVVNAKVDFVILRNTMGYNEYAPLEEIYLGDTVGTIYDEMGINMTAKCIKYTYDAILGQYIKIELGSFREDFAVSTERAINGMAGSFAIGLDTEDLLRRLATHKHSGLDGTVKISYNDLTDKPQG